MPVRWTKRFARQLKKAPRQVKIRAERTSIILDSDREHPSLHLKRLQRLSGYWEIRVDDDWRIILRIEGNTFIFVAIGRHDVMEKFQEN